MEFIPKVVAQTFDELATPTIPFTPPEGSITPVPIEGPSISLNTDQFSIAVSENIDIDIEVDTADQTIQKIELQITFDPELLAVTDASSIDTGIQINFLADQFTVTENQVSIQNGIITVKAETENPTSLSSEKVAQITFIGKKEGIGEVVIVKSSSSLLTANNTDILEFTNSINITVTNQEILPSITPSTVFPTKLPDNALIGPLDSSVWFVLATLLIGSGFFLRSLAKRKKNDDYL